MTLETKPGLGKRVERLRKKRRGLGKIVERLRKKRRAFAR
jgi:hypothetical protein